MPSLPLDMLVLSVSNVQGVSLIPESHSCHKTAAFWKYCLKFWDIIYILLPEIPWLPFDCLTSLLLHVPSLSLISACHSCHRTLWHFEQNFLNFREHILCCHRHHGCHLTNSREGSVSNSSMPRAATRLHNFEHICWIHFECINLLPEMPWLPFDCLTLSILHISSQSLVLPCHSLHRIFFKTLQSPVAAVACPNQRHTMQYCYGEIVQWQPWHLRQQNLNFANFFENRFKMHAESYGSCGLLKLETPPRYASLIWQACQMAYMASVAAKSKFSKFFKILFKTLQSPVAVVACSNQRQTWYMQYW